MRRTTSRPIALRHPIAFYEGHLPGFSFNALVKKALGRPGVDPQLEELFAGVSTRTNPASPVQTASSGRRARSFARLRMKPTAA